MGQVNDGRLVVKRLGFEGNESIDDIVLRAAIATTKSASLPFGIRLPGLETRYLNETELRRDVIRLQLFYRQLGFPAMTVDTTVKRSETSVDVMFHITEGAPVRLRSLRVFGADGVLAEDRILRDLPLQVGNRFDRLIFLSTADSVVRIMRNRGYPYAAVYRNFDENIPELSADAFYVIDRGPLSFVDNILVRGPEDVDASIIRRTIPVRTGQAYSQEAMFQSQRDLYELGVFDFVNVGLADTTPSPNDSLVDVLVQVSEGRLRHIRASAGYGTLDCFRTLTSVTVHNFLGGGRTLEVSGRLSKIGSGRPFDSQALLNNVCGQLNDESDESGDRRALNYSVSTGVRFPYVLSPNNAGQITVSAERRSELNAYVRQAVGVQLALTREVRRDLPVTISYTLSRGQTRADAATFCQILALCTAEGRSRVESFRTESTLGLAASRDRTNSLISPSRGWRFDVEGRFSSELIGSDPLAEFLKGVAEYSSYHLVGRRTVFAWRVRGGAILPTRFSFDSSDPSVNFVPTVERFYAGGPNTVRGFRQNELGPIVRVVDDIVGDPNDPLQVPDTTFLVSPTGGNQLILANAELRFPLLGQRLGGAVFVDAGQVFVRGETQLGILRITPGFGLRLFTPIGPVRFDFAINPHSRQRGQLYVFQGTDVVAVVGEENHAPADPSFLGRWRLNFSIGEAF